MYTFDSVYRLPWQRARSQAHRPLLIVTRSVSLESAHSVRLAMTSPPRVVSGSTEWPLTGDTWTLAQEWSLRVITDHMSACNYSIQWDVVSGTRPAMFTCLLIRTIGLPGWSGDTWTTLRHFRCHGSDVTQNSGSRSSLDLIWATVRKQLHSVWFVSDIVTSTHIKVKC